MISEKRLPCVFMCDGERGEESQQTERPRERMSERQSICGEGDSVSSKICINTKRKCNMISRMNGVDKATVYIRQNNTYVFLIGDI
jgi:hypothetical protein